jgi:molybdate transport system substrate-binding protein
MRLLPLFALVCAALAGCGRVQVTASTAQSSLRQPDEILVSAASSLTDAMEEIGKAYTRGHSGTTVRFNFAASGALQQQIEHGAPVDLFISASSKEMDALAKASLIEAGTRRDVAGNRLVLIAPRGTKIKRWEDLRSPAVRRIAISNPDAVPSGRYGRQTLERRLLWKDVRSRLILGENVRQTLAYVASNDAEAGIVFATDARSESRQVKVVDATVSGRDHAPIVYPAAVLAAAPNAPTARRFAAFLSGPVVQEILRSHGFVATEPAQTPR